MLHPSDGEALEATMERVDVAFERLKEFRQRLTGISDSLATESDVRLKIIDPMFVDILGWPHAEMLTEDPSLDGFIDYNCHVNGRARLIIEAKRDGRRFDLSARLPKKGYKLNGAVFSSPSAQEGIKQAIRYCGAKNAELACVTNGNEWIIFRGTRFGDGLDTVEGLGFVFADLEQVEKSFAFFYDLLSYESAEKLNYRPLFQEAEGRRIRSSTFKKSLVAPGSAKLVKASPLKADIDRVMRSFFDRLTGDQDPDMLTECFVETDESRAADVQLARVSEDILHKIRSLNTSDAAALTQLIERATESKRREFVVIVGSKGAGKSTFISRFFRSVLRPELAKLCVPVRVNLADSSGDSSTVTGWLDQQLLTETETALFPDEPPSFEAIEGIFFDDYMRLKKGTWSRLYSASHEQFQIKFGEWAEERRETDPHRYINGMFRYVVGSRRNLPVLIFDNADHFDIEFQERVYQYARSFYETELCLVIIPITDRTSWRLSRHGALQSFEHEALFLPTPPTEHVLRRRVEYLHEKIGLERVRPDAHYFVKQGITWKLDDLAAFSRSLHEIFLNTAEVSRQIGKLANYDIRRALRLARLFVTSPHLKVEDLLKSYLIGSALTVSRGRAVKALVRGNYRDYAQGQHEFVQNVYALLESAESTPLIGLRIL
jgi:GTPase SAR1 family protein